MTVIENSEDDNNNINFAPYASVILSTMGGFAVGGVSGALVGGVLCTIDEYFIANNISNLITNSTSGKHLLSTTAFYSSVVFQPWSNILTQSFPAYKIFIQGTSYALSALTAYVSSDFIDFQNKIDLPVDSFLTVNKIFDKGEIFSTKEIVRICNKALHNPIDALIAIQEDAIEIYNNPFLSNFIASNALSLTSSVAVNNLALYYLGSYGSGVFITTLIGQNNHYEESPLILPFISYTLDAIAIIGIYALKLAANIYINYLQNNLAKDNNKIIINKAAEILLDHGNSRKILGIDKEEGQLLIDNLIDDLFTLLNGANGLNNIITSSTESIIALRNLVKFSPDILLPYLMFTFIPKQQFLSSIVPETKNIAQEKSIASIKVDNIVSDILGKSELISLGDSEEFIKHKFNTQWKKIKELNLKNDYLNQLKSNLNNVIDIHDLAMDAIYFGIKHNAGLLDITKIPLMRQTTYTAISFLSSNLNSQQNNVYIELSQKRIDNLFNLINAPNQSATHIPHNSKEIIFKNYSLSLGEKEIVQLDNLIFEQGKHYAITGKSGCGKSSVLIDLKEGVVGDLSSNGEIYLPANAKIMLLTQQLFIPKESTLLEIAYFPNILDLLSEDQILDFKNEVIALFKELEIDQFTHDPSAKEGIIANIDTQKFKLSGGQMQKIAIIQAILNKPDILIMDENFSGLDESSVTQAQQILVKYLGNSTILVVDHKALSNNYNNFYDAEINFHNGIATFSKDINNSEDGDADQNPIEPLNIIADENNNIVSQLAGECNANEES